MAEENGLGELTDKLDDKVGGIPVWVIGLGVGLVVAVLWYFFRGSGDAPAVRVFDPESAEAAAGEDTEPQNSDYGLPNSPIGDWLSENPGSSAYPVNQNSLPITNAQWGRYVSDTLLSRGADPAIVTNAIAKYLSDQGLNSSEKAVINQGLAIMSLPEGVKAIKDYVTPNVAVLPAPTGLKLINAANTSVKVGWNAVAGAKGYNVYVNNMKRSSVLDTTSTLAFLKPNTGYTIQVTSLNSALKESGKAQISVRTDKK